jgi:ribosomal protein S18 acetylase RimI-like enzyme
MSTIELASGPTDGRLLEGVTTRRGALADAFEVAAMHGRCSERALAERFGDLGVEVTPRIARGLLDPPDGWSLVAERGRQVVGLSVAAPLSGSDIEVGVLVEEAARHAGVGSRLFQETAVEAARRGFDAMVCASRPDNQAVLGCIQRAGFVARVSSAGGIMQIVVPLRRRG